MLSCHCIPIHHISMYSYVLLSPPMNPDTRIGVSAPAEPRSGLGPGPLATSARDVSRGRPAKHVTHLAGGHGGGGGRVSPPPPPTGAVLAGPERPEGHTVLRPNSHERRHPRLRHTMMTRKAALWLLTLTQGLDKERGAHLFVLMQPPPWRRGDIYSTNIIRPCNRKIPSRIL